MLVGSRRPRRAAMAGHMVVRRSWARRVALGLVDCARCGLRVESGQPWDLEHDDLDRRRYVGPEHAR